MNEPDAPSGFDPRDYRRALGGFGTGVALVAAHDANGRAHGMIINSMTSVSLHPPIMLWCLANASAVFNIYTQATAFSLNILRSDDEEVAQSFSRKGDRIIPPEHVSTMETGAPVLNSALVSLDCRMRLGSPWATTRSSMAMSSPIARIPAWMRSAFSGEGSSPSGRRTRLAAISAFRLWGCPHPIPTDQS